MNRIIIKFTMDPGLYIDNPQNEMEYMFCLNVKYVKTYCERTYYRMTKRYE